MTLFYGLPAQTAFCVGHSFYEGIKLEFLGIASGNNVIRLI